jgi:hypothetical protein
MKLEGSGHEYLLPITALSNVGLVLHDIASLAKVGQVDLTFLRACPGIGEVP